MLMIRTWNQENQVNDMRDYVNLSTEKNFFFLHSEQFALFSVVQFPNEECTSSSSSTTNGTCYTTSEV